jgi:hypothetical protein
MCGNINDAYTSLDPCRHIHLQQNLQRTPQKLVQWIWGH